MLKFIKTVCLLFLSTLVLAQSPKGGNNPYYPFTVGDKGAITAPIEDKQLLERYVKLFEKYGYSGNGYCWEGHITQILEKLNPSLLKHITMDSEAGAFYAHADSKDAQTAFVKLLSPIFASDAKLTEWIKKANKARISD